MRRLGMLFVGDTSRHTLEAAAGDYSTFCTLLMLLAEALKGEGITDTLEGDTLTIRVKHIELLLVELHRDTEEAKHLDSLLEHTSRGTLGMFSLHIGKENLSSWEAKRNAQVEGDFFTLAAAVKVLKAPLKKLFSVEAHHTQGGTNSITIERGKDFSLSIVELNSAPSTIVKPLKSTEEQIGVLYICNFKAGLKRTIVGDLDTQMRIIELFEKAFARREYCKTFTSTIGGSLSFTIENEGGEALFSLQSIGLRDEDLKLFNFSREEITPERGNLRLFFKADGECYEKEVNYSTCESSLWGIADYIENLFDIYTSEGKEREVVAASTQIIMRLEPKEEDKQ